MGNICCASKAVQVSPNVRTGANLERSTPEQREVRRIGFNELWLSEASDQTLAEIVTPTNRRIIKWRRGQIIGEGAYAKVFQAIDVDTGMFLAVKHYKFSDEPRKLEREFNNLKREIILLKELKHPNIVQYFQTDLDKENQAIDVLMEYLPGGSLKSLTRRYKGLEIKIVQNYTKQILNGLLYLHQCGVIHRDLKCANILVTDQGNIKISDFGSSKIIDECNANALTKSIKGSPYWMAPEVVARRGHSFQADIWSLGCTIIEMHTGYPPWSNYSRNTNEVLNFIGSTDLLPDIPSQNPILKNFLERCIVRDVNRRATIWELMEHEFVAGGCLNDSIMDTTLPLTKSISAR